MFGAEQAAALLARIAGPERVGSEPAATAELAALCGYLPLAMRAALGRVAGALLHLTLTARLRAGWSSSSRLLSPDLRYALPDRVVEEFVDPPVRWFERERTNLVTAVRLTADAGLTEQCWTLASSAETPQGTQSYRGDWQEANEIAMAATVRAGDDLGRAMLLFCNGIRLARGARLDEAILAYREAAWLFAALGHTVREARATVQLGIFLRLTGRVAEAEECNRRALAALRQAGDLSGVANALLQLGHARLAEGDVEGSRAVLAEALEISRQAGARHLQAHDIQERLVTRPG